VQSLALWLCAQEKKNVRSLKTNKKEEKKLVDVAPHWGEPCISYVLLFFVLIFFMLFMCLSS
jgi:hypothetical protein